MNIHHNTAKRAKAHGVTLNVDADGDTVVAIFKDMELARGENPKLVLDTAIAEINGGVMATPAKAPKAKKPAKAKAPADDDEFEDGEDEGDEAGDELPESKSVIKRKYRTRYRPTHYTCGDTWADQLGEYLTYKDEDGKPRIDLDKLKAFAKANDVWVQGYATLNAGMQRLNVGNRLRAKVRKGHVVVWN